MFISEVSVTPLFLVMCHWQLLLEVAGAPHVAGSFLFLLVSDAVDVEGTGGGVCKMSGALTMNRDYGRPGLNQSS